jgi:putative peptide zinc metalloprotease protein
MSATEALSTAEPDVTILPAVTPGTVLAGEYTESGFKEPSFLARRADGQVVQLSRLLYLIAAASDGQADYAEIAETVGRQLDRGISAANVAYLCQRKLMPVGVLTSDVAAVAGPVQTAAPLLGLKFRVALVPERVVRVLAGLFGPLFAPPVIGAVLAGLVYFDFWVWGHGLNRGLTQILTHPALMLVLLGCALASAVFHELGHATACRIGGARPGAIGAGLYLVMPALYSDVTDSYRLSRSGRVRTDLGGVYFNAIGVLVAASAYAITGFEPLVVVALLIQLEIVQQFIPFLRLDGYWVISDLIGIPDLFGRIRPILLSFVPRTPANPRVTELRTRARVVVTLWVCLTVPILAFNLYLLIRSTPHLAAVTTSTAKDQASVITVAAHSHQGMAMAIAGISLVLAVLPIMAISLTATWTSYRLGAAGFEWIARRVGSPRP